MGFFKVRFKNNVPASAIEIPVAQCKALKEFGTRKGKTFIKWYIVQADGIASAMQIAGKLANRFWGDILAVADKGSVARLARK